MATALATPPPPPPPAPIARKLCTSAIGSSLDLWALATVPIVFMSAAPARATPSSSSRRSSLHAPSHASGDFNSDPLSPMSHANEPLILEEVCTYRSLSISAMATYLRLPYLVPCMVKLDGTVLVRLPFCNNHQCNLFAQSVLALAAALDLSLVLTASRNNESPLLPLPRLVGTPRRFPRPRATGRNVGNRVAQSLRKSDAPQPCN